MEERGIGIYSKVQSGLGWSEFTGSETSWRLWKQIGQS